MKKSVVSFVFLTAVAFLLISMPIVSAQTYSGFEKFMNNIKLVFSRGDNKVMLALDIREKELNSAMYNLESGDETKAKKEIESAINMLKIVQSKTTPEIADEVKSNIAETGPKINENLNLEFFEKYLTEEQKTKLIIEHSEKILEYCEELAKQDYDLMLKDEKCQNNAPDWLEDEVNNRIEEVQKQDSEEIKKQVEISMNNPKNADCDEISLTSKRTKCEKFKALAVRCEFQSDESACKEIGMFKDVQTNEREDYEQEILNKYVPAECTEAGIRDGEECKKFLITLYKPESECMENGQVLDNEACGKKLINEDKIPQECIKNGETVSAEECENVMKEKSKPSDEEFKLMSGECKERGVYDVEACDEIVNLPRPCKDAGHYTKKECEVMTLNQNLPKECVDAGALTPESCEKLKLPQKCQGEAFSNEECEAVFIKEKMPSECQESGTYNFFKCAKLLYAEVSDTSIEEEIPYLESKGISLDEIPELCLDDNKVNFLRSLECDEELIKRFGIMLPPPIPSMIHNLPPECMRDGIPVSPEECQEIAGNSIIQGSIPKICLEANVETPEECGKLLEEQRTKQGIGLNMPEECIGLDIEECKKIMEEKNITINELPQDQYYGVCDEGEENCSSEDIIKEGVPEECAKLSVYDKESCGLIMSKINAERIKEGDKVVVDDDGNTDIITNDQINQIADDADKKSNDIKPDITKADDIKQQIDVIEDSIKTIDLQEPDIDKPSMDKDNEDVTPSNNQIDNSVDNIMGGDSGNDVAPGPQGIVGVVESGGDNSESGEESSSGSESSGESSSGSESSEGDSGGESVSVTGEIIGSGNKESFLGKILKWILRM